MGLVTRTLSHVLPERAISATFRVFPLKTFREVMRIADTMTHRSQEIVDEKKAALAKGDTGLAHEVGEGKDIMSICCERSVFSVHQLRFLLMII